jgi:hypothetical protein
LMPLDCNNTIGILWLAYGPITTAAACISDREPSACLSLRLSPDLLAGRADFQTLLQILLTRARQLNNRRTSS